MDEHIESALELFYSLKNSYEKRIKIRKKQAYHKQKSKRKDYRVFKKRCVNCRKEGGTIFSVDKNILTATCGNLEKPCKLNIVINRGNFNSKRTVTNTIKNELEDIKTRIILLKTNLLYSYEPEEGVEAKFSKLKEEYKSIYEIFNMIHDNYMSIINNRINKDRENKYFRKLNKKIMEFKQLKTQYDESEDDIYLSQMIDMYLNYLIPYAETVRMSKYFKNELECDNGEFIPCESKKFLIQDVYNVQNLEDIYLEEPSVISNTK